MQSLRTVNSILSMLPRTMLYRTANPSMLQGVLLGGYARPGRHYHNLDHIEGMVTYAIAMHASIRNPDEFVAAILFHDIVYEVGRRDNEARSAEMARELVPLLFGPGVDTDMVADLIMATTHDGSLGSGGHDRKLIADLDLATFDLPYQQFARISARVRAEFEEVCTPDEWNAGRRRFLQGMLARERIYYLPIFSEGVARENLSRELASLPT